MLNFNTGQVEDEVSGAVLEKLKEIVQLRKIETLEKRQCELTNQAG